MQSYMQILEEYYTTKYRVITLVANIILCLFYLSIFFYLKYYSE